MDSASQSQQAKITLRELGLMTLGSAILALGVYFFKFPNHFSMGGVSGLSILLGQLIPSQVITPGLLNAAIIVFYILMGFLVLKKGFGLRTVYSSLLYSLLVHVLERVCPMPHPFTDQKMLELFFAVILPALGAAILFNVGSSSGGTDILALILKKYTGLDVGRALLLSDVLIAAGAIWVFDMETGLYCLLGLMLKSVLVDNLIESLNRKKSFTVVTHDPQPVCRFINETLYRGATVWKGQGAYTHQDQYLILTALSRQQAVQLRNFLRRTDPHAFMVITNSSEIFGKGFLRA